MCALLVRNSFTFGESMPKITYLSNPDLPIIKPGYRGNRLLDGLFVNGRDKERPPAFHDLLKWKLSRNPQSREKRKDKFRLEVMRREEAFQSGDDVVIWLGHASFFIRFMGFTMVTDPCLLDLPLLKRRAPLPVAVKEMGRIDFILVSHFHRDHFDKASIKELLRHSPDITFLFPLKGRHLIDACGGGQGQEAGWFQKYNTAGGLEILFLPSRHWNRRALHDFNRELWGSFLLRGGGWSLYFAGDTAQGGHFRAIKALFGPVDLCLMPIGCYNPPNIMKDAHMNPEEAVRAANDLGCRRFIPMHYGTYDLTDEPRSEPIQLLRRLNRESRLEGTLKELAVGQPEWVRGV